MEYFRAIFIYIYEIFRENKVRNEFSSISIRFNSALLILHVRNISTYREINKCLSGYLAANITRIGTSLLIRNIQIQKSPK